MGIAKGTRWTPEEDAFLRNHIGKKKARTIAYELGRPMRSVECRIASYRRETGLAKNRKTGERKSSRSWTPEEKMHVFSYAGIRTPQDLAGELNRTEDAVKQCIYHMGGAAVIASKRDMMGMSPKEQFAPNEMLCWTCRHATNPENKCPWSGTDREGRPRFDPVPGWVTVNRGYAGGIKKEGAPEEAFTVIYCPIYEEG